MDCLCGRIAQLGEHLPYKQRVIGSSPIVPTTFYFLRIAEMILDLSPIINFEGKRLNFDTELDFCGETHPGLRFLKPVKVSGSVLNIGGSLELSAKVSAVLSFECDRCCETFSQEFECSFDEVLKKETSKGDDKNLDAIYFEGNAIELEDIVLANIIVELPSKHLCSEECKGLCAECGKNLNHGKCDCDMRSTDPRFDVLDKFFE